jgi:hypothetical protein
MYSLDPKVVIDFSPLILDGPYFWAGIMPAKLVAEGQTDVTCHAALCVFHDSEVEIISPIDQDSAIILPTLFVEHVTYADFFKRTFFVFGFIPKK